MILEIVGSLAMGGLLSYTFLDKHGATDASKIQQVAANCGLSTKTQTIRLLRKSRRSWGTEYVYRLPLGLSFEDVVKKQQHLEDGLNHKRGFLDLTLDDIRTLRISGDILTQIKRLLTGNKHRREIELSYDGALIIRVYKDPMPEKVPFDDDKLGRCRGWAVCVGLSRDGGAIYHDFETIPHLVVAGTTRYGKSVFLKNVITTLTHTQAGAVKFTLIDLKGGLAFNRFANTRQVDAVAKDPDEALRALRAIRKEMVDRQKEFLAAGLEDVKEACLKQRYFIIVDEGASLASAGESGEPKKTKVECEHIIAEIARIGGGLGYRLIFATQYPTADTLPRQVKQNCDARLCFRLQTDTASQVVLDEPGAEQLPLIKGRAIYRTDRKVIVQTPFIDNEFIDRTLRPHITIKPRKEPMLNATEPGQQASAGGGYTLVVE